MSPWYDAGMAYDKANQLVTSTAPDGKGTKYAYDAAGRMVKEGKRTYRYGYLDKVLSVKEGKTRITYGYPDGWNQMAYCRNGVVNFVDYLGGCILPIMEGWEYVGEASLLSFTNDPEEPIWNIDSLQSDVHSILGRLESLNDMTVTIRISEKVTMSEYKEQYTSGGSRGDWEYYYQYCRKYDYLEKRWDMDIVMGNSFIDNLSDFATVFGGVDALCRVLVEASIIPASVAAGASIASLTLYLNQNITSGEMKTINIATRLGERETNDWHRHIWKRRIGEIAKISE